MLLFYPSFFHHPKTDFYLPFKMTANIRKLLCCVCFREKKRNLASYGENQLAPGLEPDINHDGEEDELDICFWFATNAY
ncbi:hypothetical protein M6B38_166240 [Iris pallida]|uniref:Uncharacterized protein n=1 Tax=Iris pallida TaxID=29817 RepID=A0AAX6EY18_IRIPA|nr:hypothetical protein M6B38_166240 [Iris pallida]